MHNQFDDKVELPDDIYQQILVFCERGNALSANNQFVEAYAIFKEAYELIPDPLLHTSASTWLLAALGESAFYSGQIDLALSHFVFGIEHTGAGENPYFPLMAGMALFELKNYEQSLNFLLTARLMAGPNIFQGADPKYLKFVTLNVKNLPPGAIPSAAKPH
jgi:tetratricopeptide (TPR) repeat protein